MSELSPLSRLRSGETVFGALQLIPSSALTEVIVWSGYDFVVIDCEHGAVDEQTHIASLQVIASRRTISIVRVRPGDLGAVGRYLDFGAHGIMLPNVQTGPEAAAFVAAATYGPMGTRSSTGSGNRASRYGIGTPVQGEPPLLLAMIESAAAVDNVMEIAATRGLDGVVIGPYDLSADLGCRSDYASARYRAAMERIESVVRSQGLILGSAPHPEFSAARLVASGYHFIIASVDIFAFRDGLKAHLTSCKE